MRYNYFCPNCGFEKEEFHGMTEKPQIICDECREVMKIKVTGGVGTILKGNGWVSKGSGTAGKAKHFKEIGVGVPEVMSDVVSEEVKRNAVGIRKG